MEQVSHDIILGFKRSNAPMEKYTTKTFIQDQRNSIAHKFTQCQLRPVSSLWGESEILFVILKSKWATFRKLSRL